MYWQWKVAHCAQTGEQPTNFGRIEPLYARWISKQSNFHYAAPFVRLLKSQVSAHKLTQVTLDADIEQAIRRSNKMRRTPNQPRLSQPITFSERAPSAPITIA